MEIKDGGATQNIRDDKINTIIAKGTGDCSIELWINGSLSYLTIIEAIKLRDELNNAIRDSAGL